MCNTPGMYDYQWENSAQWTYTNYTCASICESGSAEIDCVTGLQAMSSSLDQAFFATEVTRTFTEEVHAEQQVRTLRYFFPLEEDYKLTFQYAFRVAPSRLNEKILNVHKASGVDGLSTKNVHTVIIDPDYHVLRHVPPSDKGIELSIKDILDSAKRSNWLDQEQPELGINTLPWATHWRGPVGRLSGIEIHISLHCYNSDNVPSTLRRSGWKGHVCSAQILPAPPKWVFRTSMDTLQGKSTMSRYHGIRVVFHKEGTVEIFSFHALIAFLTQAFVLMQFPSRLARFILVSVLGHLSKIYGGVLTENFRITQHVSALALQTMMRSSLFDSLRGVDDGISLATFSREFKKHLDFTTLDSKGLRAFALFSFATALDIHGKAKISTNTLASRHSMSHVFNKKNMNDGDGRDDDEGDDDDVHIDDIERDSMPRFGDEPAVLDIKSFMNTTAITEKMHFDDAILLFNRERRIGLAERWFLPGFVREHVIAPKEEVKSFLDMPSEGFDKKALSKDNLETSSPRGDVEDPSTVNPPTKSKDDNATAAEANQHMDLTNPNDENATATEATQHMDLENLRQLVLEYRREQQDSRRMLEMLTKSVADLRKMQVKTGAMCDLELCIGDGCSQSDQALAQVRQHLVEMKESQAQDRLKLAALTEHVFNMVKIDCSLQVKQHMKEAHRIRQLRAAVQKQDEELEHVGDRLMKWQADKQNDASLSELSLLYSDCCLTCKVHAEQLRHCSNLFWETWSTVAANTQPSPQHCEAHRDINLVRLQTHAAS